MGISIANTDLTQFFIAILLLLVFAYVFGNLFSRWGMPKVVGEIFGGVLLGPSCAGFFFPAVYETVFLSQGELLAAVYWLGLVLLMFCSGFEIEREFDRSDRRTITVLVAGTTLIPLGFGWFSTALFDMNALIGPAQNRLSFQWVLTVALAVTSIPVLSRIFMDLGILRTEFAKIVLAVATIHDLILWVFVSIAAGLVSAQSPTLYELAAPIVISVVFFGAALLCLAPIVKRLEVSKLRFLVKNNESAVIILLLLIFTVGAALLKIHLVFGAFLAGIVVNFVRHPGMDAAKNAVKSFSLAFFVPVYFAVVGLQLDLIRNLDPVLCLTFIAFAILVQGFAVLVSARVLNLTWLSSAHLAVTLNDRGGPCIVLATLALDLGIISVKFFVALILLAIVTSLTAGLWLRQTMRLCGPPVLVKETGGTRGIFWGKI